jgi:predicted amidohydrolase YtcJ
MHRSGHAAWANSRALQMAGILSNTADPPGGEIQHDSSGQPTGIFFEEAIGLVSRVIPKPSQAEIQRAMRDAQEQCLRLGLTGLHDFDGRSCFLALQALHERGELRMRMVKSIPASRLDHAVGVGLRSGFGDSWLRIGGLKMFADGALGPRTASMIEPYEDEENNRGIIVTEKEEMISKARVASANGIRVAIHAIGDRANHDVLDVFSVVRQAESEKQAGANKVRQLRHRIEHAQILHPDDFQRFAGLNIIASMQPIHAISDMEMADAAWGVRTKNSYAWRRMLDHGVSLVFGTDAPVESIDPLATLHAATTRQKKSSHFRGESWHPEQILTTAEAVRAYTLGPAFASGQERFFGSISPGKLADMTIFSRDIYAIPPDELMDVVVDGTIVNGKFLFRSW